MTFGKFNRKSKVLAVIGVITIGLTVLFKLNILRTIGLKGADAVLTRITCVGRDKKYMTWGFTANPVCAITYADKGKSCKSSNECLSGLCVRTQNISTSYCRGVSEDYPLCSNGEATVEYIEEVEREEAGKMIKFGPFLFCD